MKTRILLTLLLLPAAILIALTLSLTGAHGGSLITWRLVLGIPAAILILTTPWLFNPKATAIITLGTAVATLGIWSLHQPATHRDWAANAIHTPHAHIDGTLVHLKNIRNFRYIDENNFHEDWYDATFDTSQITQGYLLLTSFADIPGLAHVMASFAFEDGRHIIASVEIRREKDEEYHPLGGMFRQYELHYVFADERDALALRTHIHQDPTWAIPMNAGPKKTGEFFMDMVTRANKLHKEPEWYHSITSSCASNLADHYQLINHISLPPDWRLLLPGFAPHLLQDLDLLPENMTPQQALDIFRIDEIAQQTPLDDSFSQAIRAHFPN